MAKPMKKPAYICAASGASRVSVRVASQRSVESEKTLYRPRSPDTPVQLVRLWRRIKTGGGVKTSVGRLQHLAMRGATKRVAASQRNRAPLAWAAIGGSCGVRLQLLPGWGTKPWVVHRAEKVALRVEKTRPWRIKHKPDSEGSLNVQEKVKSAALRDFRFSETKVRYDHVHHRADHVTFP